MHQLVSHNEVNIPKVSLLATKVSLLASDGCSI